MNDNGFQLFVWVFLACILGTLAYESRPHSEPVAELHCPRGELAVSWDAHNHATAVCTDPGSPTQAVEIVRNTLDLEPGAHRIIGNATP